MTAPKPTPARTNLSSSSEALRYGISGPALALNERLAQLHRARWTPLPGGAGLVATDRRGRPVAELKWVQEREEAKP